MASVHTGIELRATPWKLRGSLDSVRKMRVNLDGTVHKLVFGGPHFLACAPGVHELSIRLVTTLGPDLRSLFGKRLLLTVDPDKITQVLWKGGLVGMRPLEVTGWIDA